MAETTDPQTTDVPEAPAASGAQGGGQTPDAVRETAAPTLTREQEDAIAAKARRDADARAKAAEKRAAEAEAERDAYRAAEAERKAAEMTEVERAAQAKADAEARAQAAEDRLKQAEVRALRAEIISTEAADLPATYKSQVTGDDADAIRESLAGVRDQHKADAADLLRRVSGMAPEDIIAQFGEDAAAPLAARLTGKPQNVGAAPRPGTVATPPDEWSPDNNTPEAWRKERERRGIGSIR